MWRLFQPTLVKIGSEVITGIINKSMFYQVLPMLIGERG